MVCQYRLVNSGYFLDSMQPYEAQLLLSNLNQTDRNAWERTRLQMYTVASLFAKNKLTVTDIMHLPWDDETTDTEPQTTEITNEEITRLNERAEEIKQILNNHASSNI